MKASHRNPRSPAQSSDGLRPIRSATAGYLHDAVFSMEDGFFVFDREWRYVYANPAGCELIGKPLGEILGYPLWDVIPGLLGTDFEREYRRAMDEQTTVRFEAPYEPYGAWFKIHAYPSGENLAVIARNITQRQQIQQALVESEARHRAIVQAVPDLMLWIGSDGWVLNTDMHNAHPLCHSCAMTDEDGVLECHLEDVFADEIGQRVHESVRRVIETGSAEEIDFQFSAPGGDVSVFEARVVPVDSRAAIMVVQDVTDRRRLELEVLRVSEDVRQEIGRDLHDGLSSHLTGVAMLARRLARDVRRGRAAEAEAIDELAELIADGNEQARRLARGLNPVVIERDGLCAALTTLVRSMQSSGGPRVVLESNEAVGDGAAPSAACPAGFPAIDVHLATHLYRIAQEATHNAVRHSDAAEVRICLVHCGGTLRLSVADDGRGFAPSAEAGMGINVMRYRARLIGATLEIGRRPEGGTLVACDLPLITPNVLQSATSRHAVTHICCG